MLDSFDRINSFDSNKGIVRIGTEINSRLLFRFNQFLTEYYGRPPHIKGEITDKNRKLYIEISSAGGEIFEALNIYDLLRSLSSQGVEVHTVGYGMIASAAVVIFCAGDKRYSFPTSRFMIHQPFFRHLNAADGKDLEIYKTVLHETEEDILKVFTDTFKKKPADIKKDMKKKDFYLTGKSAVDYGLVTDLI